MAEKMGAHDKTISLQRTLHAAQLSKKYESKGAFCWGSAWPPTEIFSYMGINFYLLMFLIRLTY